MQSTITIATDAREGLYDITDQVKAVVAAAARGAATQGTTGTGAAAGTRNAPAPGTTVQGATARGATDRTADKRTSGKEITTGICSIYVRGATAGIMIQENWDDSVQRDVVTLLDGLIPRGVWEHDRQDGNGDSHLKAGLVGPSETIPISDGHLALSTWQNIFLCEFDGPRKEREIVITIIGE